MITTWSRGVAGEHMDESLLVELGASVRKHPWWRARTDLILQVLRQSRIQPPARVLDVGCGWGVTLERLERKGFSTVGLDVSRQALERLDRADRDLVEADITQPLPPSAPRFDAVLLLDVLEHLDDDRGAVARLAPLVRPGGVLIASVPALPELFGEFDELQGHRRRYTMPMVEALVNDAAWSSRTFWWGSWSLALLRRQRTRPKRANGEPPAATYLRYLHLPPWPAPLLMRAAYRWEQPRALNERLKTGSSLFTVATKR